VWIEEIKKTRKLKSTVSKKPVLGVCTGFNADPDPDPDPDPDSGF
jgi:hypothetical protein